MKPTTAVVDLGYRGVDALNEGVQIIHRGKRKSLTPRQRKLLRRRQSIEPVIGHLKADRRMDRCWYKGQEGDALRTVLSAVGFNLRWLLRKIVEKGIAFFVPACSCCGKRSKASQRSHHSIAALLKLQKTNFSEPTHDSILSKNGDSSKPGAIQC